MEKQKTNKWKIIAIIFICLFTALAIFNIYAVVDYNNKIEKTNICYYDICGEYPQAFSFYEEGVCTCYYYDMNSNIVVAKEEYIK